MSEATSFRPKGIRFRVLRAAGLLVLAVSLVLPATGAADALNLRQRIDRLTTFNQLPAPISQVTINAADSWVEVIREEIPLSEGAVRVTRTCVLPSTDRLWSDVSTAGESGDGPADDRHVEVFARPITGWEQTLRRCETWVRLFVDHDVTVRVWDAHQVHEVDLDLARWTLSPDGALIESGRRSG